MVVAEILNLTLKKQTMKTMWTHRVKFYKTPAASIETPTGLTGLIFIDADDNKLKVKSSTGAISVIADMDDIAAASTGVKPYKAFVALMTGSIASTTSGDLVVGRQYMIETLAAGDDFANVGYVAPGTSFIATDVTPTTWANSTEVIAVVASTPSLTILENGLSAVPAVAFVGTGKYTINGAALFPVGKTSVSISNTVATGGAVVPFGISQNDASGIAIVGVGEFSKVLVEIRVYNP